MINSYRIIPTYTGDVSGIASALYELGGMVVIHDPSGCNSTYNTHDETRWYDEDSLIYISGLSEMDAILGNDQKFIEDILFAAEQMHPAFIALTSSPIPFLNGTDFQGIAKVLQKRAGIPVFYVRSNGTHDYSVGAGEAFRSLAELLFADAGKSGKEKRERHPETISINLLGLTPLDYDADGVTASLQEKLKAFRILSSWSMGSSLEDLKRAADADVNLVVSVTGLAAAQYMEEKLGIPYVVGTPIGSYADVLLAQIREAARSGKGCSPEGQIQTPMEEAPDPEIVLVGEPVIMQGLAEHLRLASGIRPTVINPLETACPGVERMTRGEEDLEAILAHAKGFIGDPLYRPLLPAGTTFAAYSHEAFSGRCFRRNRINLLEDKELEKICL